MAKRGVTEEAEAAESTVVEGLTDIVVVVAEGEISGAAVVKAFDIAGLGFQVLDQVQEYKILVVDLKKFGSRIIG